MKTEKEQVMLYEKLVELSESHAYPFHMPGHKRQELPFANPYMLDITEIPGFDNLHHSEGILLEEQKTAAEIYGSQRCYYLVNGSTCGILAALSAAVSKRGRVLIARNCHKAVYHGVFLRELSPEYIYPKSTGLGIQGQVTAEDIRIKLEENPDIQAVMITSPTYDGVVSDVEAIARVVHSHDIPLIVDQAHGAHFGFSKDFPESAVGKGADIVITSVHKTLPAFTQTALLHVCSNRVSQAGLERFLGIYQTSSPSYVLMAGISQCMQMIKQEGKDRFEAYGKRLHEFYERTKSLKSLQVVTRADFETDEAFDFDFGKIMIMSKTSQITGIELYDLLFEKYQLHLEMASGSYVVAMTGIMDTDEGFSRLAEALLAIDKELKIEKMEAKESLEKALYIPQEKVLEPYALEAFETEEKDLQTAIGSVSGDYVFLYPPGIPILVPGERITETFVHNITKAIEMGLDVQGLPSKKRINIVNFS